MVQKHPVQLNHALIILWVKLLTTMQQLTCFNKKDSDLADLLTASQKTIDKYPKDCIYVYTDDSAFKDTTYAGYWSSMQHQDKTCEENLTLVELNDKIMKQKQKQ